MKSSIFGVLDGHATSHKLTQSLVDFVDAKIEIREGFHLDVFKLPHVGAFDLVNGLYGPSQGDEPVLRSQVSMETRKFWKEGVLTDRDGETPMVNLPERPAAYVVVIWVYGLGDWCEEPTLYTIYGHGSDKASPMEPWDKNLKTEEEVAEAERFWAEHAISMDQLIID